MTNTRRQVLLEKLAGLEKEAFLGAWMKRLFRGGKMGKPTHTRALGKSALQGQAVDPARGALKKDDSKSRKRRA